jgi:virginiamycin A acetyltransferase
MILASPLALIARLEQVWGRGSEVCFSAASDGLSLVPSLLGSYLRQAYYIMTLEACGLDVSFGFGSRVSHRTARIGNDVTVGGFASLGTVTIADHVLISPRVSILSGGRQHQAWDPSQNINDLSPNFERVHIGTNTWIGEGAIVLADVGERCIVSVGSVVTRAVPGEKLVIGNPARAVSREWRSE